MDIIWQDCLDDKYDCKVMRTGFYTGKLTVRNGDDVLLDKEVPLSYGAEFGPDVDDVNTWQDMCIKAVDGDCGVQ